MSWSYVCLLIVAFVLALFGAAVFAPPGYTLHTIAAVWAACTGLILVLPMDRR